MDYEEKKSTKEMMIKFYLFLKDPKIKEILKLCIQPKSENDMEHTLMKFGDRCKELSFLLDTKCFWKFDFVCMCVLDYNYTNDSVSLSAVLRSLYLYVKRIQLPLSDNNPSSCSNTNPDYVLKILHEVTDLYTYSKCQEMMLNLGLASILEGNLGLASFLVKFGFVAFPSELNERGKKTTEILVKMFNCSFIHPLRNVQAEEMEINIQVDKLLNLMQRSDINFKRTLLTFCSIILISEYRLYEKVETDTVSKLFNKNMKIICLNKFMCLKLFIDATTETKITLKDIESFIVRFINPLLNPDVGSSLIQASREMLCSCLNYYNPRSLKDLVRCEIRANLQNSMTFPEQIKQLDIPTILKEFLLFSKEGIWLLLKLTSLSNESIKQLKIHASLTRTLQFHENMTINAAVNV